MTKQFEASNLQRVQRRLEGVNLNNRPELPFTIGLEPRPKVDFLQQHHNYYEFMKERTDEKGTVGKKKDVLLKRTTTRMKLSSIAP